MIFLVQIRQGRHSETDRENEPWQENEDVNWIKKTTARAQQLEDRRSMCLDPVRAETRDPRAYMWTVNREPFDPNCLPNPIKHPQTRFDCRMFMMSEISLFQSPLLLVYEVHDPQAKTNGYLFYTKPSCPGSNRNLLTTTAIVKLPTQFIFLKSLFSNAYTHVDQTHINCGLQEFGAWISSK